MYASHFNWLQVSFRRTSLSSTGFESRKGERFPRAQGRRYLSVSASILLYFESLILNPTLRCPAEGRASKDERPHTGRHPSRLARKRARTSATVFFFKRAATVFLSLSMA